MPSSKNQFAVEVSELASRGNLVRKKERKKDQILLSTVSPDDASLRPSSHEICWPLNEQDGQGVIKQDKKIDLQTRSVFLEVQR